MFDCVASFQVVVSDSTDTTVSAESVHTAAPSRDSPIPADVMQRIFDVASAAYETRFGPQFQIAAADEIGNAPASSAAPLTPSLSAPLLTLATPAPSGRGGLRRRLSALGRNRAVHAAAACLLVAVSAAVWMRTSPLDQRDISGAPGVVAAHAPQDDAPPNDASRDDASAASSTEQRSSDAAIEARRAASRTPVDRPRLASFAAVIPIGRLDAAISQFRQLTATAERAFDPDSPIHAERLGALAELYDGLLPAEQRTLRLLALVDAYQRLGRMDDAVRTYRDAFDMANIANSRPLRETARTLADAARRQARHADAVLLLSPWESQLSALDRAALADSRRALDAQHDRLLGTGRLSITNKVKSWTQSRVEKAATAFEPQRTSRQQPPDGA
jgi:tetratricopeptide (TPR) repeat protein